MTVTNWRPLTRSLSYYFSWVPGGISKCSKLSKCKTIYYSWFQLVALPPILQLQSELVPWFCLLTASSPHPHLLTWPCLSMLYIEIPSCNFHFQYLGWCQCHLCFGFYINHLSMSLTLRCCGMLSHFSRVWLFGTPSTVARQALLSMEFSRQEYWSGLPFPSPGDLPDPGIEPASLTSLPLIGGFFTTATTSILYTAK